MLEPRAAISTNRASFQTALVSMGNRSSHSEHPLQNVRGLKHCTRPINLAGIGRVRNEEASWRL